MERATDDLFVERFGFTYRVGDKVMQTENDYDKEVFNGDLGYVRHIDPDSQELVIEFDGTPVDYQFGGLGSQRRRRSAIAATLARPDADVIALREVWSDETINFGDELVAELDYHGLLVHIARDATLR